MKIDKAKFDRLLYLKALNYTELAELAGVQVMTISKMANGKTTPRAATLRKITKGALTYAFFVILVDPRGVEPLSENLLIRPSPSAVRYLNFPSQAVNGQTSRLGSHFLRGRLNGERPTHVHR